MKKILFILMALPFLLSSCDDEEKVPDVSVDVEFSGATLVDGVVYVVQGNDFAIKSVAVSKDSPTKDAMINRAAYHWDYGDVGFNPLAPFAYQFETAHLPVGSHSLLIECQLLVVGYPVMTAALSYPVEIVASADEIPSDGRDSEVDRDRPDWNEGR